MFRFILIFTLFSSVSFAQNAKGIFSIVVEGKRSDLTYFKKRSELTMARSTKYCRGSMMPKSVNNWSCKKTDHNMSNCVLEYKCSFVNKKFNRLSETRRIRKDLKSIPKRNSKYKITLLYKDSKEVIKQLGGGNFVVQKKKSKNKKFKNQYLAAGAPTPKVKKKVVKKKPATKKKTVKKRKKSIKEEELEELAALSSIEEEDFVVENKKSDNEWILEKKKKTDGTEEFSVLKKEDRNKGKNATPTGKRNQWTSFSLSYLSVSDDSENSLATFDIAWTPHMWFADTYGVRGQLGLHQFKLSETVTTEEEVFFIYDLGVFGLYRYGNLFAELGLGLQIWNNSEGSSFNSFTLGGGYIFEYYKLKFIDRISASFSSVSNEFSTKEFRVSVGGSF